jgi:hypothetical protein
VPVDFRKFKKEIEGQGYSVVMTNKGHYYVVKPNGGKLVPFAVGHGRNKGLVLDAYVSSVRKAIQADI